MHPRGRMACAALGLALLWAGPLRPAPALARAAAERPSGAAEALEAWVVASGDNGGRPFLIVDKLGAEVFVFDAQGRLEGAAPALIGLARGDDTAPGLGDLPLAAIRPEARTTPAGRFEAHFGEARGHHRVLWVDWADEIALHPVVTVNPREHRLQRLRSPAAAAHRITFGCINVPSAFYRDVVLKAFAAGDGVVYILPDTRPVEEVFPGFAAFAGGSPGPRP